jgi:hypothetical protein
MVVAGLLFSSMMALIGCNSVEITANRLVGAPTYPPTKPAGIQILRQKPTQAYDPIADLFVQPTSPSPSTDAIEQALRQQAAKFGADAVLVLSDKTVQSGTEYMGAGDFQKTYGEAVHAQAIKYRK